MKIPKLQTAMCGWTSILTLLNLTENMPGIKFEIVDSKNSGDSRFGSKQEVVGYAAIAVEQDKSKEKPVSYDWLSPAEKQALLKIARQTIVSYTKSGNTPAIDRKTITEGMNQPSGAFVTLTKNKQLRGCIGSFSAGKPLYQVVQDMAISAAVNDSRFDKVAVEEIDKLKIEISVLTPMKKIASIDEIKLGRDGVYIKDGFMTGTFLPQVATETGWSKEEFLGYLSRDKAGLGWDGWKKAELYTYQAIVFGEKPAEK